MAKNALNIINKYFLPYQKRWLEDESRIKIWQKSRRIGATYVQSYEDVRDCVYKKVPAVWFSSADLTAAREYIEYCKKWAALFKVVAEDLGEVVIDESGIKAFTLEFANGTRIIALSSNPTQFRSKGGKIVLDEFAWHEDQERLWAAARPCITWGFPLRIISTHNGKSCKYFKFTEDVKRGILNWILHTTPIHLAVEEGLADKISGRKLSSKEKDDWVEEERKNCGDESTWLQEYCCEPVDETTAFLTYDLITSCEMDDILKPVESIEGDMYVGFDVGRKKDLSVITVKEKLGAVKYTRAIIEMKKTPFYIQRDVLFKILQHKTFRRACIDATGLGMQIAEEAQMEFGKNRVEAITFTGPVKEELAFGLLRSMQDKNTRIPAKAEIREDFHSVKKIITASGNIRFDADRNETDGHADRFWSSALANHAADNVANTPTIIVTRGRRKSYDRLRGY